MGIPDTEETLKLAVFAADLWQHVCPVMRITGPAEFNHVQIIKATTGKMVSCTFSRKSFPRRIWSSSSGISRTYCPYQQVLELARAQGKPVIYEIDDLLAELPALHPDYQHYRITRSSMIRGVVEAMP